LFFLKQHQRPPDLLALLLFTATSSVLWLSPASGHVRISTKVSWDREIAPIVEARCVSCHREGGRAPMALTTYEEARPWAKAIKEEVLTRRMPKWHVVRGYGDFANDPSLSAFEIALLASWADGGAPKSLPNAALPPKGGPLPPKGGSHTSSAARTVTVPCTTTTLPAGRLVAVRPILEKGDDVRIDVDEQPLLWLKDFDPGFAETYWLRQPLTIARRMPMRVTSAAMNGCSVALSYAR
jgi:hypothetical protein